jgi:mRNA interferase RelE/StbE
MAKYKITFKHSVTKDLLNIPNQDVIRILNKIESLSDDPRAEGCIKITGKELYRVRQGIYRVIYEVFDQNLMVNVIKVVNRPDFSGDFFV